MITIDRLFSPIVGNLAFLNEKPLFGRLKNNFYSTTRGNRPRTDAELPGLEKVENLTCGNAA
jgi:hypothetical protein